MLHLGEVVLLSRSSLFDLEEAFATLLSRYPCRSLTKLFPQSWFETSLMESKLAQEGHPFPETHSGSIEPHAQGSLEFFALVTLR